MFVSVLGLRLGGYATFAVVLEGGIPPPQHRLLCLRAQRHNFATLAQIAYSLAYIARLQRQFRSYILLVLQRLSAHQAAREGLGGGVEGEGGEGVFLVFCFVVVVFVIFRNG